jgi:cysteine synthase A
MARLGLETEIVDYAVYARTVERFRDAGVVLPTFAELADPSVIPASTRAAVETVAADEPHPLNLFRVHWHNDSSRRRQTAVPEHIVLPEALTGVKAAIIVVLGDRFPMIRAHKVLAAYACLAPRIITGQFDPTLHKALWPSTGNYCRGGVAISRIMGCRGVAILPAGMSEERFRWLEAWVTDPADIIRTPGSESNVKEIYDACAELDRDPANIVFNQFCEFGNYLAHYQCTGSALARVFDHLRETRPQLALRGFVSATGSAGTLAAGDYLKERYGSLVAAVEALECPTMLENGFGEHNIQGIGDKHIPLIHNVMNTDVVVAVSDRSTDQLGVVFSSAEGREYLVNRRRVDPRMVDQLSSLGLSSICNVLAAIKIAKHRGMGGDDAIVTIATDGAEMYASERRKAIAKHFAGRFDGIHATEAFAEHILGATDDHLLDLSDRDRRRIFNLGYFTWVEQQGITIQEFTARRDQRFWHDLRSRLPLWDEMIVEFNRKAGVRAATA